MLRMAVIDFINFCIVVTGLSVSILGFVSAVNIRCIEVWQRRFLTCFFGILIAYCLSDLLSQISLELLDERFAMLSKTALFFESLFSSMLMPMLYMYLMHLSGETKKTHRFTPLSRCG